MFSCGEEAGDDTDDALVIEALLALTDDEGEDGGIVGATLDLSLEFISERDKESAALMTKAALSIAFSPDDWSREFAHAAVNRVPVARDVSGNVQPGDKLVVGSSTSELKVMAHPTESVVGVAVGKDFSSSGGVRQVMTALLSG